MLSAPCLALAFFRQVHERQQRMKSSASWRLAACGLFEGRTYERRHATMDESRLLLRHSYVSWAILKAIAHEQWHAATDENESRQEGHEEHDGAPGFVRSVGFVVIGEGIAHESHRLTMNHEYQGSWVLYVSSGSIFRREVYKRDDEKCTGIIRRALWRI